MVNVFTHLESISFSRYPIQMYRNEEFVHYIIIEEKISCAYHLIDLGYLIPVMIERYTSLIIEKVQV